jgi:hypothetical protein
MWMIPSELTSALKAVSSAFDGTGSAADAVTRSAQPRRPHVPPPAVTAAAGDGTADAALAEAVHDEAGLEGATAAVAQVELPPAPDVPLPEAVPAADAVEEPLPPAVLAAVGEVAEAQSTHGPEPVEAAKAQDPGSANGAAAPG